MAELTRAQIKAYFETGDIPTESQFIDTFDSIAFKSDDLLDEDDLSSNSNSKVASQQSIKAYVDNIVAGLTGLASEDIDTLAEINAILTDANLVSTDNLEDRDRFMSFAFGDEESTIEVGTDKLTFQMPNFATVITGVSVNLKQAPVGSGATFDLNENGTSVLSTVIKIDSGDTSSEDSATPPVISGSSIAASAVMTVDIDSVGTTGEGIAPKFIIYFKKA